MLHLQGAFAVDSMTGARSSRPDASCRGWSVLAGLARLDRLMLDVGLSRWAGHEESLALNLSSATLADPRALNKVFELLRSHSNLGIAADAGDRRGTITGASGARGADATPA